MAIGGKPSLSNKTRYDGDCQLGIEGVMDVPIPTSIEAFLFEPWPLFSSVVIRQISGFGCCIVQFPGAPYVVSRLLGA
jgi:hypothetical protein